MSHDTTSPGYGVYLRIWLVLLGLTVVMVFLDQIDLPRVPLVMMLVGAMLVKASLIAGYFMHLRYDGIFLVLTLIIGFLFFGAFLYALIVPDALRILGMLAGAYG